jgi:hypothetical protein
MTTIQIQLPDKLAQQAQRAGLLSSERLEAWVRDQLNTRNVDELFIAIDKMTKHNEPTALTPETMAVEIQQMRAELRAHQKIQK